jgi:hypothetical protein
MCKHDVISIKIGTKLSDFPAATIAYASQFSGGAKPRPYLFMIAFLKLIRRRRTLNIQYSIENIHSGRRPRVQDRGQPLTSQP